MGFYYSGLAGLDQDLVMAKKFWLLSASQWVNSMVYMMPAQSF